jgi:FeS assembly SUF system regulator
MFRISKLTDYGVVVLTHFARHPEELHNAREITEVTRITLPTVTKILKILARERLLISHRGTNGGYVLARGPETISMATIIEAIEGNLGLTECSRDDSHCALESSCVTRHNWRLISHIIYDALERITLAEMAQPLGESLLSAKILNPTAKTRSTPTAGSEAKS